METRVWYDWNVLIVKYSYPQKNCEVRDVLSS